MTLVADLRTKVMAVAGVGTRVYWKARPANSVLPCVVLHLISGRLDQTMSGPMGTQGQSIQADCMASTKLAAETLKNAVVAELVKPSVSGATQFQGGFINFIRDDIDDAAEGLVHIEQIGANVWIN